MPRGPDWGDWSLPYLIPRWPASRYHPGNQPNWILFLPKKKKKMVVRFLLPCFFSHHEGPVPTLLSSVLSSLSPSPSFKYCSALKSQFKCQSVNPFQNNFPVNHGPYLPQNEMPVSEPSSQTQRIRISSSKARNLNFDEVPRWFQCSLKFENLFPSFMAHACSRYCQYPDSIIQKWVLLSGSPTSVCVRISWKANRKCRGPVLVNRAFVVSPTSPRWSWFTLRLRWEVYVEVGGE